MRSARSLLGALLVLGFGPWSAHAVGPSPCSSAGGGALPVCSEEYNANYSGELIQDGSYNIKKSPADCCASCSTTPTCNVWVYCNFDAGCDNGSGTKACALKSQSAAALASGQPQAYARGDSVNLVSGFVLNLTGDFDKTGLSSTEAHANYRAGFNDDATPLVAGEANLQPSALACSQSCQNNSKCTVYVYCPKPAGCDNGYGKKYPYQGCTLKQLFLASTSSIIPNAYSRGANVSYTSGVVQRASGSC